MTLSRLSFFSACRSPSFVLFTSCAPLHSQCGDPKPRGLMRLFALLLRTSWVSLSLIKFTGKLASPLVLVVLVLGVRLITLKLRFLLAGGLLVMMLNLFNRRKLAHSKRTRRFSKR